MDFNRYRGPALTIDLSEGSRRRKEFYAADLFILERSHSPQGSRRRG
jgi:hypothetical protein